MVRPRAEEAADAKIPPLEHRSYTEAGACTGRITAGLVIQSAAALLYGVLLNYNRRPKTFDANDQVQEYEVVMNFEITLKNPADGSEIWKERMNQSGIYDVLDETEESGQDKAIELLVEAIINKTTKSW